MDLIRLVGWSLLAVLSSLPARAFEPLSGNFNAHDPSKLIKDGNRYYFFRSAPGVGINWSTDLRSWTAAGTVFPPEHPPSWTTNTVPGFDGNIWAPDVAYFNGRYHLYYSISSWGTIDSAIGLVTTPSLISPVWTDHGKVVQSDATWEAGPNTDLTSYNCIDPAILQDTNGTIWMVFGSYSDGIVVMQLDPATGKRISPESPITRIANNGPSFFSNTTEGASVFQRGGYYWLFLNFGGCCSGVNSTYNIRVGRSTSITGPYVGKDGASLMNGGGTMLLESTGKFIGPGHASVIDDNGTNWFTYHYYDGSNNDGPARFGIAQLHWGDDGWPVLTNNWSAFYTFEHDARENRNQFNGTLQNGATIVHEPDRGGVLHLNGTRHVTLPLSVPNANTFAAWVKWNGGGDWQRIFDFGSNTTKYAFLTPRAANGRMRFAIRNGGGEQIIDAATALPTNAWTHVAVTLDGSRGSIYLNGQVAGSANNISIRPWQLLARSNYLGASQFANDPGFNGLIDSVRVFGRTLSADEIRELAWAHPSLAHRYSFNKGVVDSIGLAHGKVLGGASVTNGAVELPGAVGSYVQLPGGLATTPGALTAEFWASFGANGAWSRVFDFGNINGAVGQNYLFYSPRNGAGGQRLEISTQALTTTIDTPVSMESRSVHVVCIVDPVNSYWAIYTNGVRQVEQSANLPPLTGVSGAWGFLGRSLFGADGWLNGRIDEFRLYGARLTPEAIRANFVAGPDALAIPIRAEFSNVADLIEFRWPSYGLGFVLDSASELPDAAWIPVAGQPQLVEGEWRQPVFIGSGSRFFRLRR